MIHAPVLHVNAEDPEAVVRACILALKYQRKFKKDIILDVIGFRKVRLSFSPTPAPSLSLSPALSLSH